MSDATPSPAVPATATSRQVNDRGQVIEGPPSRVPPSPTIGLLDWLAWPFRQLGKGASHVKSGGAGLVKAMERPIVLACLIAVVGGFVGGEATKIGLPDFSGWHWPWHWPTPTPPIPPAPPAPIPAKGLHVLIVVDNANISKMPAAQVTALTATSVRSYLNATCPKGPDGQTPEYRIWDAKVDASAESQLWQDALKKTTGKALPWIVVSNPDHGGGFEGALPADTDSLLKLLQQFGG